MNKGLKSHALVGEVLRVWECIVNRVAKSEVGEKMIVCGKSASSLVPRPFAKGPGYEASQLGCGNAL